MECMTQYYAPREPDEDYPPLPPPIRKRDIVMYKDAIPYVVKWVSGNVVCLETDGYPHPVTETVREIRKSPDWEHKPLQRTWKKNGVVIPIAGLTDAHLIRAFRFCLRKAKEAFDAGVWQSCGYYLSRATVLEEELETRQIDIMGYLFEHARDEWRVAKFSDLLLEDANREYEIDQRILAGFDIY